MLYVSFRFILTRHPDYFVAENNCQFQEDLSTLNKG